MRILVLRFVFIFNTLQNYVHIPPVCAYSSHFWDFEHCVPAAAAAVGDLKWPSSSHVYLSSVWTMENGHSISQVGILILCILQLTQEKNSTTSSWLQLPQQRERNQLLSLVPMNNIFCHLSQQLAERILYVFLSKTNLLFAVRCSSK